MNRFLTSAVAISSVLALVAAAQADNNRHGSSGNSWKPQKQSNSGGWGGFSQVVSGFKNHHGHNEQPKKNPPPIDPGRGDGRVPVTPTPDAPPVVRDHRDGFVFVNGHWERAKAPTGPIIRDHRTPTTGSNASGGVTVTPTNTSTNSGPIVRDHRTPPVVRDHRTPPVVRDHRTGNSSAAAGGITVTNTTNNSGPIIRDHRTDSSNASGGITVIKTNPSNNTGPIIRDHRTGPIVRDHRTEPVVRDHRTLD